MKTRSLYLVSVLLAVGIAWAAKNESKPAANVVPAFEKLKALAGDWEATDAQGKKVHAHYEVIGGGSAVIERFVGDGMGGADNAMETVYYVDGNRLLLTHYCMAKNQPRMQAQSFDSATNELHFRFLDATGLASPNAGHMHNASFRFKDADHFDTEWQFFENGKQKFSEAVEYTRVARSN